MLFLLQNNEKITAETYVPLSPEGQEIKDQVRRPRQMRVPVGYNQAFLEAYYPNETAYLPPELRDQLRKLGTPPDGDRPAGTFARDIMHRLLIDLSWASSRLEGNTYSRLDTERLIEFGQVAEGKDVLETQMILNHKAAIELLLNEADLVDFTPYTILSLHALLSDGLLEDSSACGRIRSRPVEIGGSVYRPIAMPHRLEELFGIIISMARESRPVRTGLFRYGSPALPATVRGCEQAGFPTCRQHPPDQAQSLPPVVHRRAGASLHSRHAGSIRTEPHRTAARCFRLDL